MPRRTPWCAVAPGVCLRTLGACGLRARTADADLGGGCGGGEGGGGEGGGEGGVGGGFGGGEGGGGEVRAAHAKQRRLPLDSVR